MKVVHVPRRFCRNDWGGTETVILNTIKRLEELGVEGEIYTTKALDPTVEETIEGVRVRRFDYFYPFLGLDEQARLDMDKKGGNLFSFSLLKALLREADADLLHAHTGKRLGGIVRTAARIKGIPYVVSVHGGHIEIPAEELDTLAAPRRHTFEWGRVLGLLVGSRRVMQDADAVICVGRNEYEKLARAYPDTRVEYIPNGVDTAWFASGDGAAFRRTLGLAPDDYVILTVGRIDPQKNQRMLIEAMPAVLERIPSAKLVLVGPVTLAGYERELDELVERLGLRGKVFFAGGIPAGDRRLADAYHAADVFVLPSRHEPFGIVVLEAWSAGLPVVASAVGGIPHFTEDGGDCLLFAPGDAAAMVGCILELRNAPRLARTLAERGRLKAADEYDWSRIAVRVKRLYEELAAGSKRKEAQECAAGR